jgi:hypothetical protein
LRVLVLGGGGGGYFSIEILDKKMAGPPKPVGTRPVNVNEKQVLWYHEYPDYATSFEFSGEFVYLGLKVFR